MVAAAWPLGYEKPGRTTLIDAESAANFTSLAGAGVTVTTDNDVLFDGRPTTRVFVPAALATFFEVGVSGASVVTPSGWNGSRLCTYFLSSQPSRLSTVAHYVGSAAYADYYVSATSFRSTIVESGGTTWDFTTTPTWSVGGGSPTFPGTKRMKARFAVSAGEDMYVWIGAYRVDAPSRAKLLLTVDDGYDEQYDFVYTECLSRNIPFTIAIDAGLVDDAGFVTTAECQTMLASGLVEFANHQVDNESYAQVGLNAFLAKVDTCKAFLQGLGNSDAANRLLVHTQGSRDTTLDAALQARGYVSARAVTPSETQASNYQMARGAPSIMYLRVNSALDDTQTLAQTKTAIDTAITNGTTCVLMGHKFAVAAGTDQWAEADFTALLDFLVLRRSQGLIDIPSWTDWYRGLTQPALVA